METECTELSVQQCVDADRLLWRLSRQDGSLFTVNDRRNGIVIKSRTANSGLPVISVRTLPRARAASTLESLSSLQKN
jgi:hypothetical protein